MPDPNFPLLVFPKPDIADRNPGRGGGTPFRRPSIQRQRERISPKFAALGEAFAARRLVLQQAAPAENPELVVVLETVGSIDDFAKAVARVPGLEWLLEWVEEDIPPDQDFFIEDDPQRILSGRLFLLAANEAALDQLIALWNRYQQDPTVRLERGLAPFKHVFEQLKDIRYWNPSDRIGPDVRAYWEGCLAQNLATIKFEVEAWYYSTPAKNDAARDEITNRLGQLGGHVLRRALIPEIGYHGFLVELPTPALAQILEGALPELVLSDRIMFFRPKSQSLSVAPENIAIAGHEPPPGAVAGTPVVALLDGFPLQNHPVLAGRVTVDDPDGWEPNCEAKDRVHGTAMASLIVHGELDAATPALARPLYARPILRPDATDTFHDRRQERTPDDVLLIDLVHSAVKRICEGSPGSPPVAPTVRIINLSVCDDSRLFSREMSPWARLLDWLAYKYGVLFVVSAGNYTGKLRLSIAQGALAGMTADQRRSQALADSLASSVERRLIAPAESINALTVGALHSDGSTFPVVPNRYDLFAPGSVSPYSRLGHGFRRAVKPDVLFPGGRVLHLEAMGGDPAQTVLDRVHTGVAPGHKVAIGPMPGGMPNATTYCRGTSNATALATRAAAQAWDILDAIRGDAGDNLPETHDAVLLKALICHGASWGNWAEEFLAERPDLTDWAQKKDFGARWLGYGPVDVNRILSGTAQRATMLGVGSLTADQALVFSAPLPPSLAGKTVWRRLTITMAWFSPSNHAHRSYRRAKLWVTPPQTELQVRRFNSVHDKAAQRGTLQHELLEGDAAVAFVDGARFECKVNCAADAGTLDGNVPFALCVTLEVAEATGLPIYQEIRARIAQPVAVQA